MSLALWLRALLVAHILVSDPHGFGGIILRARAGPVRERWLHYLQTLAHQAGLKTPLRRIPLGISDENLLGGLDLEATIHTGKPVFRSGVMANSDRQILLLPMAERVDVNVVSRISMALDQGLVRLERDGQSHLLPCHFGVVALDEGIEAEERANIKLQDRLAFHLSLDEIHWHDLPENEDGLIDVNASQREQISTQVVDTDNYVLTDEQWLAIAETAMYLGVHSVRALHYAAKTAVYLAAMQGADQISDSHLSEAIALVISPRATQLPSAESAPTDTDPEDDAERDEPPEQNNAPENNVEQPQAPAETPPPENQQDVVEEIEDSVLEAAKAAIPADLLSELLKGSLIQNQKAFGGKTGARKIGRLRGRPLGSIPGNPHAGVALSLIDTLRTAAPWQAIRKKQNESLAVPRASKTIHISKSDFRVRRYQERTQTLTIFAVDASGSAAMHRLAEAKGAVELLLAECYVRRDQVAVLSFRGTGAEILLPSTRSLVRAKRSLAEMPGGGGTPLADAIYIATEVAQNAQRHGLTPVIVFLTDGRANIGRNGMPGRAQAQLDAEQAARYLARAAIKSLWIDTSPQARIEGEQIAKLVGSIYLPLPHAGAKEVSQAVLRTLQ
ncbi:MAG: magnesium chelatase subunit D [Burkholderiales bacterium]|nr:magnesium chelatase subunit D [Burkholderiales bacterium]